MNLLETILGASGGQKALGEKLGLNESQVRSALGELVPALGAGVRRNTEKSGGLESLLGALSKGEHSRYLDRPELMREEAAQSEGNAILGHLLGSKDVSRQVAGRASERTGIDEGILKKMLPLAATMVMGSLNKNQSSFQGGAGAGGQNMLASLLDGDGDGSIADDVAGMLKKLF